MPAPRDTRGSHQISPPDGAVMWGITHQVIRKSQATGRNYNASEPCVDPEPAADGSRATAWPVSEFSKANVLAVWGPGKYRVCWYGQDGQLMPKELSVSFEVAQPSRGKKKGKKLAATSVEAEAMTTAGIEVQGEGRPGSVAALAKLAGGQRLGFMEVWQLMESQRIEERRQREADLERYRIESAERQQRDREFMAMMIQSRGGAGGGAVNLEEHLKLLRREMALQQRETSLALRAQVRELLDQGEPAGGGAGDDEEPGFESLEEAGSFVVSKLLRDVASKPGNMLEQLMQVLRGTGVQVTPTDEATLRAYAAAQAAGQNGVPRA